MPRIHLFNPENDLALAFGGSNYTPPANAIALHRAGASLPLFYGERGDIVIADGVDREWAREMIVRFDLGTELYIGYYPFKCEAAPWGWSFDARRQLLQMGVSQSAMPDDDRLTRLRQLSHRRLTVGVMRELKSILPFELPQIPIEAHSADEVLAFREAHGGCYVKLPWSSSGRGVIDASALPADVLHRRVEGMIRNQGSVMCEVVLDKVEDFAMLFYSDGYDVKRVGYSAFFNEHGASYGGNIVANDIILHNRLTKIAGADKLAQISVALQSILSPTIAPYYKGYFGVDMMVYRYDGEMFVAPCVEVNLRMTMGVVAWRLAQTVLADGLTARFSVSFKNNVASRKLAVVENHRLVAGTIDLIPTNKDFSIILEVIE